MPKPTKQNTSVPDSQWIVQIFSSSPSPDRVDLQSRHSLSLRADPWRLLSNSIFSLWYPYLSWRVLFSRYGLSWSLFCLSILLRDAGSLMSLSDIHLWSLLLATVPWILYSFSMWEADWSLWLDPFLRYVSKKLDGLATSVIFSVWLYSSWWGRLLYSHSALVVKRYLTQYLPISSSLTLSLDLQLSLPILLYTISIILFYSISIIFSGTEDCWADDCTTMFEFSIEGETYFIVHVLVQFLCRL